MTAMDSATNTSTGCACTAPGFAPWHGLDVWTSPTLRDQRFCADGLARALRRSGERVARVFPNAARATLASKRLADAGVPLVGTFMGTFAEWAAGRWLLYGDGRQIVDTLSRRILVLEALDATRTSVIARDTIGLVRCIEGMVRDGLGAKPFQAVLAARTADGGAPCGDPACTLDTAEREVTDVCHAYADILEREGYIESGQAAALLPGLMGDAGWEYLLLDGIDYLDDAAVSLVVAAAAHRGVALASFAGNTPAWESSELFAARLGQACSAAGVGVRTSGAAGAWTPAGTVRRSPEVAELVDHLFVRAEKPVTATGAVRFCLPAGRYAEPECISNSIKSLVAEGIAPRDIVVACKDPLATARSLAGRLAENPGRAIGCLARGPVPVSRTDAGKTVLALFRLGQTCAETEAGTGSGIRPGLNPGADPRPDLRSLASDVARSPLLGLPQNSALRLDVNWRQNRAASAGDYLDDLAQEARDCIERARERIAQNESLDTGGAPGGGTEIRVPRCDHVPALVEEARRGNLAQVASLLLQKAVGPSPWNREQAAALRLMSTVDCDRLQLPGHPGTGRPVVEDLLSGLVCVDSELYVPANDVAAQDVAAVLDGNPNAVRVTTLAGASEAPARALVLCDLTAQDYPVADRSDAKDALWRKLGMALKPEAVQEQRRDLRRALENTSDVVVFERCLQDEDAQAIRPAALFEEVVDCYCPDPSDIQALDKATALPRSGVLSFSTLGEERFAELASPVSLAFAASDLPRPALGLADDRARSLLFGDGKVFSPTSIEAYLNCPLRWFYEIRLPNQAPDADFGPSERGLFVHDVLRRFHQGLGELGIERITPGTPAQAWEALADRCFDETLAHQAELVEERSWRERPLVPITQLELKQVEGMRAKVHDCIGRDALLPEGFVPSEHEWSFGDGEDTPWAPRVEYGGVALHGTVDRIDRARGGGAGRRDRLLVVDYKGALSKGHRPIPLEDDPLTAKVEGDILPQHSQILMYVTCLQRLRPSDEVVGGLYVSYSTPTAAGFVDAAACPGLIPDKKAYLPSYLGIPPLDDGSGGFGAYLAKVEHEVALAMDRLREGDIEPNPRFGKDSCAYCPVRDCGARRN